MSPHAHRRSRRSHWPTSSRRRATSPGSETAPSTKGVGDVLTISMKYSADRHRTISGLRRISTPGLRVYRKGDDVPRCSRSGCGCPVHQPGADDRPRCVEAQRGRRGPLLTCGEVGSCHESVNTPIAVPGGVDITHRRRRAEHGVTVKGPKGTLSRSLPGIITIRREQRDEIVVEPSRRPARRAGRCTASPARWSTTWSSASPTASSKELEIIGVGYRSSRCAQQAAYGSRVQPPCDCRCS